MGACFERDALERRYKETDQTGFTTAELAHLVSCNKCLDAVNTILGLPLLADRSADDARVLRIAKLVVPLVALVAIYFTLRGGQTIVALLLMGYSFVTQLFPALVLSLPRNNWVTREGAAAGIVAGVATVAAVSLTHTTIGTLFPSLPAGIKELNVGSVALAVNIVVLIALSAGTKLASARNRSVVRASAPPSRMA